MRIAAARLQRYCLPLRSEWATAAGGFSVREGWLLQIETSDGRQGYGDCAPLRGTGTESAAAAEIALRTHAKELVGRCAGEALAALPAALRHPTPAARCAVESALLDLLAQDANLPLARYLQRGCNADADAVAVNAALGSLQRLDDAAVASACAAGFSVLKLKVGTQAVERELADLRRVAALLPAGTLLRLDANGAWRQSDAERFLATCAGLPIEMLEEPLADPQPDALRRLQALCVFSLALDESLADFEREILFAAPPVRRLVLKPPSHGGLLTALALARKAAAAGLECIVTSSIDSACGVLAAAHLAAALDNGLAHGLATSSWLAQDTGSAPRIAGGRLSLSGAPGIGFIPGPGLDFSDEAGA